MILTQRQQRQGSRGGGGRLRKSILLGPMQEACALHRCSEQAHSRAFTWFSQL